MMKPAAAVTPKIIGLMLFLLTGSNTSRAQDIFVVGTDNKIYELDATATLVYAGEINTGIVTGDIAIAPTGLMYGLKNGFLSNPEIIEINLATNSTSVIGVFPIPTESFSLVCGNDHKLYALGSNHELWTYNLLDGASSYIDNLGTSSPGDITFYKGNIVFQSANNGNIMAYNLDNGSLRTVMCRINDNPIWGISNRFSDCGDETIIVTDYVNNFYELDFSTGNFNSMNVDHSLLPGGVQINGMASVTENSALSCDSFQFVDVICSVGVEENDPAEDDLIFFPNPTNGILNFKSSKTIESLTVFDASGKIVQTVEHPVDPIDLEFLDQGIYYVQVRFGDSTTLRKVEKI